MALLNVVPLDFEEIKKFIVDKFVSKGYSADFEGSNAAVLADIISYTLSHLNTNTAFNTGEMLLTTATRTESVLNLARQQGYEAQGIISYQYKITLEMKPDTTVAPNSTVKRIYELPRYSKFTSGTKSYYYMGDTLTFQRSNKDINDLEMGFFSVTIKEGTLYQHGDYPGTLTLTIPTIYNDDASLTTQSYIDIPFTNVEDEGVEIFLTYVDEYGVVQYSEEWTKTKQFLLDKDAILNKKFFRLDDIKLKTPRVYFNMAGVGTVLRLNTDIEINALISTGAQGVASGIMNIPSPTNTKFAIYDGADATKKQTLMVVGRDLESIELIRENAPLFHNSANRAVTKYDYQSIINRQNSTQYSQVWGGEVETPVKLGHIYASIVPTRVPTTFTPDEYLYTFTLDNADDGALLFLQETEYRNNEFSGIFDVLDEFSVITIQKNHRSPVYLDFNYDIRVVRYNRTVSKQAVHQSIFDVTRQYFTQSIEQSEANYFHSNLIKRIDTNISDSSGVVVNLNIDINIYPQNVEQALTDVIQEKIFTAYLAIPYEVYYDGTTVITEVLPNINTVAFLPLKDLVVDYTNIHLPMPLSDIASNPYFHYDILIDGIVCGRYHVQQGAVKYIRVDLYVLVDGTLPVSTQWNTTTLVVSNFAEVRKMKLDYYSDSMSFFKNSFPRLKSVVFRA